jgi:hypothetical protein
MGRIELHDGLVLGLGAEAGHRLASVDIIAPDGDAMDPADAGKKARECRAPVIVLYDESSVF